MNKKGFLHGLMMMACCIVPIIALLAFSPLLRGNGSGFNWSWLFILLCPLMHIFMMKGMMGNKGSCHGNEEEKDKDKAQLADDKVS